MEKEVQIAVVGKVFKPNPNKVSALNRALIEYLKLVKWYLIYNSKSKSYLHKNSYGKAKRLFKLNAALIQTARDKAIEILKSFEKMRKEDSVLRLKHMSIRFEHDLAVAVAISKRNPEKPVKGLFWRGEEIKRIRELYSHIRRTSRKEIAEKA